MSIERVEEQLKRLAPISLAEMAEVSLMTRMDTKYMTDPEKLSLFLEQAEDHYFVQEVGGKRLQHYLTLYFDTPDLQMFLAHQNGRLKREKIRMRWYVESDLIFLEVKDKNNKGQTVKIRIPLPEYKLPKNGEAALFLRENSRFTINQLSPHVETNYRRITLVSKQKEERLTIDIALGFSNERTEFFNSIPNLVIIELKQKEKGISKARELLSSLQITPFNISKYCLGSVMTNPAVKHNRFKPKVLRINKLISN